MERAEPLRLLMVQTVRFGANGITAFVLNYCRHFDPARVTVDFVFPNDPPERIQKEIASRGGMYWTLPMRNRNPFAYVRKLAKIVRENKIAVVHAHGNSATLFLEMAAAKRGGARVRIPHSHNTTCKMQLAHKLLYPAFSRSYTDALACGQEAGEWLFRDRPFTVMNNAIDTARFAFNPEARARLRVEYGFTDAFVVCHVGTFNEQKNHAYLIDVFEILHGREPSARLLLLGDGPLMDGIQLDVYRRGLGDAVRFVGAVPDAAPYLSAADAFVLPSLHEGLPFTLIEAQCAGLPCYVSDAVTEEAKFVPNVTFLSLADGQPGWAMSLLSAKNAPERKRASADAAAIIDGAGYGIVGNTEALMAFYENAARMQKLFLVTHKMTGGGCERVVAGLANAFSADGVDVTLVSECRVPSFYPLSPAVQEVYLLGKAEMRASDVWKAYRALRSLVQSRRPDVVLAMPEKVNVWTVLFLLGTGAKVVVSERNDPARHPENQIKRLLRKLVYPFAAGFVFQTERAAAYFPASIQKRGVVLPNPLDVSALPTPVDGPGEATVLAAGRLHPQKNFAMLLRAFCTFYRTHPDWKLVVYGEGAEREALAMLAASLPAGVVSLPGQTAHLQEKLADCGVFVLPSDYEGMPNALIEAMAMGRACIATDCPAGGPAALIHDGENGVLIPVGDEAALAQALARLADDAVCRETLGKNALSVRERLDGRRITAEWRRYLDGIAAK